jgi:hypothetical protein
MHPRRGVNAFTAEFNANAAVRQVIANDDDPFEGFKRTRDDGLAIFLETAILEMAMRIDERH